jgi:hypothetical protein
MAPHVDLVENRWSAGYQERVGTVFEERGSVQVKTADAHYRQVVLESMPELLAQDPARFTEELARRFHSDYFFATELHDEDSWPFGHGERIPFQQPARLPQPLAL